jgi:predicted flap endonuclease-1-like 5' DNA nuclease
MDHYLLELALWMLFAVFLGCIVGCLLRKIFGGQIQTEPEIAPSEQVITPASPMVANIPRQADAPRVAPMTMAPRVVSDDARAEKTEVPLAPVAPTVIVPAAAAVEKTVVAPPPPAPRVRAEPAADIPAAPRTRVPPKSEAPAAPLASTGKMQRPKGISAPRGGKADNLQRISGIGPKNEKVLHNLGFFHFDQIAEWTKEQMSWVDDHLKFNGRIGREEWIKQAKLLAEGKDEEFAKLYGTGGLKGSGGQTQSGTRTRRT